MTGQLTIGELILHLERVQAEFADEESVVYIPATGGEFVGIEGVHIDRDGDIILEIDRPLQVTTEAIP